MPDLHRINLNYLLNKAYYDTPIGDTKKGFSKFNSALINRKFLKFPEVKPSVPEQNKFHLKTVYPGLLIGIGNVHDAGTKYTGEEPGGAEIKLGFTLDYVTGLPVIPGSTVKGVLRSAFMRYDGCAAIYALEESGVGVENIDISSLLKSVFDSAVVFFDAVPVKAAKGDRLFGLDNITPHSDPLKDPIPLTMLKVMPEVIFLFRFGFERWNEVGGITAEKLCKAFEKILTTIGIGAKTNVGYGVMKSLSDDEKRKLDSYYLKQDIIEQVQPATTEPGGICRISGCTEKTPKKRDGSFHLYCQKHYMEILGSKKTRGGAK